MGGVACTHATDHRSIHACASDDHLAFGEGGQIIQQIASYPFNGSRDTLLVDLIDDTHDALRLALTEYIGVEFAGALANQADADAKFSPLGQHLLEDGG